MSENKGGLGTSAVFFTAISTILGAIMFLRFGYAVGNLGFSGTLWIIIIGHLITIPTAMAIAEIATNQKVEGGGEYYIISRSFGLNIGGAIGVALYLSQAISVAFYVISFAQAFEPVFKWLLIEHNLLVTDIKLITIPTTLGLVFLIMTKGADLGMKVLYIVVGILGLSLVLFFLGPETYKSGFVEWDFPKGTGDVSFFAMFAICFPGFTGMTAGVGLSGDLKNPSKSIPIGTLAATVVGMIIYIGIIYKLSVSASPEMLADPNNQLVMSDIALWGHIVPIIPIGLAAATVSSALGSILVAPRTLQALGGDKILPMNWANKFVSSGKGEKNEPLNATIITAVAAIGIVLIGDVNFVAEIISMFFLVTYGAICLISFFEHFAADPAYRPSFKSKWYLSLIGALGCFVLMFRVNPLYAFIASSLMVLIYIGVSLNKDNKQGMTRIFQGVISQLSRRLQVFLQKVEKDQSSDGWRPSVICISEDSFDRFSVFEMLRWISYKYGFGTYIHRIDGYLSKETNEESKVALDRLIKMADKSKSNVYLDTMISPSFTSAIAQVIQLPGISGKENNMILFEYEKEKPEQLTNVLDNFQLIKSSEFDVVLLASSVRSFGFKRSIHIWITSQDFSNANLMILMGYIILGHPDWKKGSIKIFAMYPKDEITGQKSKLENLIKSGRLPISTNNIELITKEEDTDEKALINQHSKDADLTILGFRGELVKHAGQDHFQGYDALGDVLFMNTNTSKEII